jgi:hypothetical protein
VRKGPRTVSVDRQLLELSDDAWRSTFFVMVGRAGGLRRREAGGVMAGDGCEPGGCLRTAASFDGRCGSREGGRAYGSGAASVVAGGGSKR